MKKYLIPILFLSVTGLLAQNAGSPLLKNPCNPKVLPVLWQQTSAEYRALCYQAFNLAELRINEIPEKQLKKGHLAIITDLDETILDNSFQEARLILDHQSYSTAKWKEWTSMHAAPALPGAVGFLKHAYEKGIAIFYISNRDTSEYEGTLENLRQLLLPCADSGHLLLLSNASSKEPRRQKVSQQYNIVMLLGDNLNDFTPFFEKKSIPERQVETDRVRTEWGKKFIVLPNSTYGEWENAIYGYKRNLTQYEKDSIHTSLLKGY